MISTLLGMWTCGLLLAAIVVQQEKVDWTYWRFTALMLLVAAVAMTAFAFFAEPAVVGGRPVLIAAGGLVVLGAAIELGVLIRTAGKPLAALSGRVGPCIALVAGLFVTYGFAVGTGILHASQAGWAEAAVVLSYFATLTRVLFNVVVTSIR